MYLSLQICRALAALMVVCFHVGDHLHRQDHLGEAAALAHRLSAFGDAGVMFFFVLSGFIVTRVHRAEFDQPRRLGAYLLKRATRIYPIYWLVFGITYAGLWLSAPHHPLLPPDLPSLIKAILLIPQQDVIVGMTGAPVVFVAWTLQYEMVFYAILALAFLRRWLLWIPLAGLLVNWLHASQASSWLAQFMGRDLVCLLALGAVLAWYWPRQPLSRRASRWLTALGAIGFMAWSAWEVVHFPLPPPAVRTLVYGLCSTVVIAGLTAWEDQGWHPDAKGMGVRLGHASYALYLIHAPWMSLAAWPLVTLDHHTGWISQMGQAGGILALLLIASSAAWLAWQAHLRVEQPMLRWIQQRTARLTRPS